MRNWRPRQPFFVKCCENGTEFEAFGSRSLCGPKDPISVRTYFRVPTGRPGQSSPYTRDSCRQRSLTSFALLLRRGQRTKPRNRPGPAKPAIQFPAVGVSGTKTDDPRLARLLANSPTFDLRELLIRLIRI